jgi:hypothetical protein
MVHSFDFETLCKFQATFGLFKNSEILDSKSKEKGKKVNNALTYSSCVVVN